MLKEKIKSKLGDFFFLKNRSGDFDAFRENKTLKSKLAFMWFYLWHMKTCGQGRVIGRFTGMIPEIAGVLIIIQYFGINPSGKEIVFWVLLSQVIVLIIGYFYMYFDIDRIESTVNLRRDEFQRNVIKLVKDRDKL